MVFKSRGFFLIIPVAALLLSTGAIASDNIGDVKEKVSIGGYSFWQFGQIVKGDDRLKGPINLAWQNGVLIGLTFKARTSDYLNLVVSPEFYLNYPYPQEANNAAYARPQGVTYINEAYGNFSFGGTENPLLQARLGMFLYKYNRDVRNLGDYLFRTGTYPTYIINNFDFPAARLLGLQLTTDAIDNLHADLMMTSEAFIFPFGDFSLSGIASYKLFNVFELGAGISLARIFSVTDSLTSPKFEVGSHTPNTFMTPEGDTGYYSFKATKAMARASIDFKPLLGSPEWLGPEDLRIYGEVCWVGIEGYNEDPREIVDTPNQITYRPWYKSLNERTPRMVGINLPAFRLLDVLSGELEYFPSVLPNDYSSHLYSLSPMPYFKQGLGQYKKEEWDKGFWRWSVYARKMITQGFCMIGEAAFDHTRTTLYDGSAKEYECLTKAGHWHWKLKFSYAF